MATLAMMDCQMSSRTDVLAQALDIARPCLYHIMMFLLYCLLLWK